MLPTVVEVIPAFWTTVKSAQIVNDRAVVFYGVQIYATSADVITFYDGQNDNAPEVFSMHIGANASKNIVVNRGILLTHGLYVGGVLGTTTVTVAWLPYQEPVKPSAQREMPGG